jgi:MFS family permease
MMSVCRYRQVSRGEKIPPFTSFHFLYLLSLNVAPPLEAATTNLVIMTISSLIHSQLSTLHLFLSTPSTRTPTILLLIASFGSSLHHPVTTFFYLAVIGESAAVSIGTLGFIQGLGGTVGGPIVGWALDKFGPWIPIVVTATACSLGCLWRGFAKNLAHLQMGAVLNGVGVNLWTVVLGHLVKSFPPSKRSEVFSGIGIQLAVVQICGKALFPLIEYTLKNVVGISEDLLRYRLQWVCALYFASMAQLHCFGTGETLELRAMGLMQ